MSTPDPSASSRPVGDGTLLRNLSALRRVQPTLAELVDQAEVPCTATQTVGRDGSPTYLLPGEGGRLEWLGRSSMPTVSADALYGECSYDGANVALPEIMTGVELLVLARRMPPQSAIFIVEADAVRLRLAMQLFDYSALIDSGRAVFLDARDLNASLGNFFAEHPGYTIPRTLYTGAVRAPARVTELQRRFEFAGEAALRRQNTALVEVVERLRRRDPPPGSESPRVALVSVDQRLHSLEQGRRLGKGLSALGAVHAVCLPTAPDCCHPVAGLRAIESIRADLVLSVNVGVERWRAFLPPDLPIGAIALGEEAVTRDVVQSLSACDLVFAASPEVERTALQSGLPREQCRRFDPAADDGSAGGAAAPGARASWNDSDIVIVGDLPDDRAEQNDITLPSHITLWNAVIAIAEACARGGGSLIAQRLLQQAEDASGVHLAEPELRRFFEDATRRRIVPATLARLARKTAAGAGLRVIVCGTDGERVSAIPVDTAEPVVTSLADSSGGQGPRFVFPIPDRRSVEAALDAAATGVDVVLQAGGVPFGEAYPQLANLAPLLMFYRNPDELRRALRSRPGDAGTRRAAVQDLILREHTVARRAEWMIAELWGRRERITCGPS